MIMEFSNFLLKYNLKFRKRHQCYHQQQQQQQQQQLQLREPRVNSDKFDEAEARVGEEGESRSTSSSTEQARTRSSITRNNQVEQQQRTSPSPSITESRKHTSTREVVDVETKPATRSTAASSSENKARILRSSTEGPTHPHPSPSSTTTTNDESSSKRPDEMDEKYLISPGRNETIHSNNGKTNTSQFSFDSLPSNSMATEPAPGVASAAIKAKIAHKDNSASVWICRACTLENKNRHRRCQACHERKPVDAAPAMTTTPPLEPTPSPLASPLSSMSSVSTTVPPKKRHVSSTSSSPHSKAITSSPKKRKSPPKSKVAATQANKRVANRVDRTAGDAKEQQQRVVVVPLEASPDQQSTVVSLSESTVVTKLTSNVNSHSNVNGATTMAARVSTSPFVPTFPSVGYQKPSTSIRDETPTASKENQVNRSSHQSTSTNITEDEKSVATRSNPRRWKLLLDQYEVENEFLMGRVQRAQTQLHESQLAWVEIQQQLERAQQQLLQAQQQWRNFQHEYDNVRKKSLMEEFRGDTDTTADAAVNKPVHQSSPSIGTAGLALATGRRPPSNSSTIAAPISSQPINTATPALSGLKLRPGRSRHPASRRTPTTNELNEAVSKLTAGTQPSPNRSDQNSQSQEHLTTSVGGSPHDTQATIDPDLDPCYNSYQRQTLPQHQRMNHGLESAGASLTTHQSVADRTNNVLHSKQVSASVKEPPESTSSRTAKSSKPDIEAAPVAISTSNKRTTLPGWESNKPSRDFLAPRRARPNVSDHARNEPKPAKSTNATVSEAEWVRVARNARQEHRNRMKPRDELLWNDDGDSPSKDNGEADETKRTPNHPYQEVVRCKAQRQALPCHDCYCCRPFYAALPPTDALALLQNSRHRAQCSPSETPRDFWVVDFVDELEREDQNQQQEEQQHQLQSANVSTTTDHAEGNMDQLL